MPVFITFEGLDGSGKTTQLDLLVEHLRSQGRDFVVTREPGGTSFGERIRDILLAVGNEMTIHSEAFLFAAARAELASSVVRPALAMGRSVLCDRYLDSSIAYQAYGGGLPPEFVVAINEMGTGALRPHRTILLDVPAEVALSRLSAEPGKRNRMESKPTDYYRRVREGYLELAAAEPRRIRIVDGDRAIGDIQAEIRALADAIWPRRVPPRT